MIATTALAVVAIASAAAISAARSTPPSELAARFAAAATAIRDAREAGASTRAPMTLALAEDVYARALLERRRQDFRPRWLRSYGRAASAARDVHVLGGKAVALATLAERRDQARGQEALSGVQASLSALDRVGQTLWIAPLLRERLQRARILTADATRLTAERNTSAAGERLATAADDVRAVSDAVHVVTTRFADPSNIERWNAWVDETVRWSARTGKAAIVIDKDEHILTLYEAGAPVRRYAAELGWNNAADKRLQGDGATPEGRYFVTEKRGAGKTRYHRALMLDYPNADDRGALARMKQEGQVRSSARAGGLIEIHGAGGRGRDWTDGCVAVTDPEIEELLARAAVGTPVTIVGSRTGAGTFGSIARGLSR